jgi:hypothetical protein
VLCGNHAPSKSKAMWVSEDALRRCFWAGGLHVPFGSFEMSKRTIGGSA